jgi:glycosylphosphatidylinositol transamidase
VNDKLEEFFKASGLKVARQSYEYKSAGETYAGENIYAILHAPRGDATEAIVLVGAWRNMEEKLNRSGVALILTLARIARRGRRLGLMRTTTRISRIRLTLCH